MEPSANADRLRELKTKHSDFKRQMTHAIAGPADLPAWEFLSVENGEVRLNTSMLPSRAGRSGAQAAVMRLGEVLILGFGHE